MGRHHHNKSNHHVHHHGIVKDLKIALILNASFTILEFFGGIWTNSIAILSDAVHDLGDTIIIIFAILLERLSDRPGDDKFQFGYRRLSPLAGLITSIILLFGSTFIIIHAIPRLLETEDVYAPGMLVLAVLGIIFNGAAILRLRSNNSINERSIKLHLMEDVLGWVAVLVGSISILIWEIHIIDPILSILIAGYIFYNASKNCWQVIKIFLQQSPDKINLASLKHSISKASGIREVTSLRIWSLDGHVHVADVIVRLNENLNPSQQTQIKEQITEILNQVHIQDVTIETELS